MTDYMIVEEPADTTKPVTGYERNNDLTYYDTLQAVDPWTKVTQLVASRQKSFNGVFNDGSPCVGGVYRISYNQKLNARHGIDISAHLAAKGAK